MSGYVSGSGQHSCKSAYKPTRCPWFGELRLRSASVAAVGAAQI
jgi:hypothetical protein